MAKCKNCVHITDMLCDTYGCKEYSKFIPMTNADRIRKMTDEELAEFIKDLSEHCLAGIGEVNCSNQITCENCKITALNWLKKEVE